MYVHLYVYAKMLMSNRKNMPTHIHSHIHSGKHRCSRNSTLTKIDSAITKLKQAGINSSRIKAQVKLRHDASSE